ncbi:YitT family protein [Fodinisporobacter ferrooxydans]|uniref:YitT family protein n=1 Tax=Fodinisporobacter ferrooxydans TaxID=2901836 RepID=A0ABY4CR24_9BACL|nr:YitT family protein [Alicyclobacillaceae bacterium MYW30-H2]
MKGKWNSNIWSIFGILLGSFIYSAGLNNFIIINHLAEGGFVGISILFLYLFHIPVSITFFVLNVPLLILAWKFFGRSFIWKTILGVVCVSVFSEITQHWQPPIHDRLLAALYGGVVTGIGLGIIFRFGATTGGSDIIARLVRQSFGLPMGRIMFSIDVMIIVIVAFLIGKETAMYSLVALFVASRVIDFVLEGPSSSKAAMIISEHPHEIAERVHKELERGTTLLKGRGGFTGQTKEVVYCVVAREQIFRLQQIVAELDERAFVVMNDVHDVLGEGFTFDSGV